MRVLHCIPGMGGGGAERQLAYLAGPLASFGWDVHVALQAGGPNLPRLEQSGATIHRLHAASSYDPRLLTQLAGIVRRIRPDLVQAWFVQMDVLVAAVSSLTGVPWILSERSAEQAYPANWKNRLRIALARTASAIVANSRGGREYWQDRVPPAMPLVVIPNAVPVEEIARVHADVPGALAVSGRDALVLSIGRLDAEKNAQRVFAACCELARRPSTKVVLCGEGPLRRSIVQQIEASGLKGRLEAPGYIEALWPILMRADAVLAGGAFEGRPNAVLETMAAGRPLVVSDIPAHREILDDTSATWVNPHDAGSMARGVASVLDDPSGAAARAAAARSRVQQWSVASIAAEYDRMYRAVLSGGAPVTSDPVSSTSSMPPGRDSATTSR